MRPRGGCLRCHPGLASGGKGQRLPATLNPQQGWCVHTARSSGPDASIWHMLSECPGSGSESVLPGRFLQDGKRVSERAHSAHRQPR